MKLTIEGATIKAEPNLDKENWQVMTTMTIEATVKGEADSQVLKELQKGAIYLTLSSAPVRAVKRDTKPPTGAKRGRKPTQKPEAPPAQPQGQQSDSREAPTQYNGEANDAPVAILTKKKSKDEPMFDLSKGR